MTNWHAMLSQPRTLLILDLVGALNTSILTFVLLACEVLPTGLPKGLLIGMSVVAAGFACFDFFALFLRWAPSTALKTISFLNLSYCFGVVVICTLYSQSVTRWGLIYFGIEIPIVVSIACWEWWIATRQNGGNPSTW
jgi:hypothetical protein